MAQPPWKDALARARRGGAAVSGIADAGAGASRGPGGRPGNGLEAAAAVAPGLAPLLAERQALEQRMLGLTGQSPADPRYVVEPLDRRRAAIAAWAGGRDAARDAARAGAASQSVRPEQAARPTAAQAAAAAAFQAPTLAPPPLRGTAADSLRGTAVDGLRGTAADELRVTPGEQLAEARARRVQDDVPPLRAVGEGSAGRERPRRKRAEQREEQGNSGLEAAPPLPAERAAALRADAARKQPARKASARQQPARKESAGQEMLDRRLARARDLASRSRRSLVSADRALDAARDAISTDWRQRRLAHVPGLGRDDPYVRETARKLSVAVGSVQEFGEKADRMRSLARDVRELKAADEANDEARRERALERLKARREEA